MSTVDPGTTPSFRPAPHTPLPPALPPTRRRVARRLVPVVAALTLIAGGTAVGVLWRTSGDDGSAGPVITPATSVPAASTSASSAPTPSGPTGAATTPPVTTPITGPVRALPVYYVADVGTGPRLYREFHRVAIRDNSPALTALVEMLSGTPVDPDYTSMWPSGIRVLSLTTQGGIATVDLSGFVAVGSAYEQAAVQQLVYTVTAADPTTRRVRLLVNGATAPSGHQDWSAPIARSTALGTQANVWILGPAQGATVSSPVAVSVLGTGFEGNVPLRVYQGETVVASTFVTTMMGGFAQARTTIALPPGSYELRAYNDSGLDASLQLWDTKTFTVR